MRDSGFGFNLNNFIFHLTVRNRNNCCLTRLYLKDRITVTSYLPSIRINDFFPHDRRPLLIIIYSRRSCRIIRFLILDPAVTLFDISFVVKRCICISTLNRLACSCGQHILCYTEFITGDNGQVELKLQVRGTSSSFHIEHLQIMC